MKIFKAIYTGKNNFGGLRIFYPLIFQNNRYKYKIVYQNKIYPLQSEIKITDEKIKKLELKIICYNNITKIKDISEKYKSILDFYEIKKYNKKKNCDDFFNELSKMVYSIKQKKNKIRIFGKKFIEHNKERCNILYKNKTFPLQEFFLIEDIDKQDKKEYKFELYLNELKDIIDRSYMFYECDSLIEFSLFNYNQKIDFCKYINDFSSEDEKK